MRNQLIVKIPKDASVNEINSITKSMTEYYIAGYPLFIFPGWEYEIVETTEPMMIMNDSKFDKSKEEIINALRNARNHMDVVKSE